MIVSANFLREHIQIQKLKKQQTINVLFYRIELKRI